MKKNCHHPHPSPSFLPSPLSLFNAGQRRSARASTKAHIQDAAKGIVRLAQYVRTTMDSTPPPKGPPASKLENDLRKEISAMSDIVDRLQTSGRTTEAAVARQAMDVKLKQLKAATAPPPRKESKIETSSPLSVVSKSNVAIVQPLSVIYRKVLHIVNEIEHDRIRTLDSEMARRDHDWRRVEAQVEGAREQNRRFVDILTSHATDALARSKRVKRKKQSKRSSPPPTPEIKTMKDVCRRIEELEARAAVSTAEYAASLADDLQRLQTFRRTYETETKAALKRGSLASKSFEETSKKSVDRFRAFVEAQRAKSAGRPCDQDLWDLERAYRSSICDSGHARDEYVRTMEGLFDVLTAIERKRVSTVRDIAVTLLRGLRERHGAVTYPISESLLAEVASIDPSAEMRRVREEQRRQFRTDVTVGGNATPPALPKAAELVGRTLRALRESPAALRVGRLEMQDAGYVVTSWLPVSAVLTADGRLCLFADKGALAGSLAVPPTRLSTPKLMVRVRGADVKSPKDADDNDGRLVVITETTPGLVWNTQTTHTLRAPTTEQAKGWVEAMRVRPTAFGVDAARLANGGA